MAWIKLDHVTPDKPEVHRMAEVLKLDADTVLGKLSDCGYGPTSRR